MFFINPPFGNYINLPKTTRIYGSYTLYPRSGLIMQIIKTLRYSKKYGGWVNKIGLRNKGVDYAIENVPKEHIISVAIMNEEEIPKLIEKIPKERNIELNISCPNVKKSNGLKEIEGFLNDSRKWCIIKLSPMTTEKEIHEYYKKGFRQFHCCNTIPVKEGGLSGKTLIPYTEKKIEYLKSKYKDVEIISGGGIERWSDVKNYERKGASHFSVSTGFFNPFKMVVLYWNYRTK